MSFVIGCDIGSLSLDDIFRLVSGIDVDGNIYIRLYSDENHPAYIFDLDCNSTATALDILRGALVTNDEGEYALNITTQEGDDWILATGAWRDRGVWEDDKLWHDNPV